MKYSVSGLLFVLWPQLKHSLGLQCQGNHTGDQGAGSAGAQEVVPAGPAYIGCALTWREE